MQGIECIGADIRTDEMTRAGDPTLPSDLPTAVGRCTPDGAQQEVDDGMSDMDAGPESHWSRMDSASRDTKTIGGMSKCSVASLEHKVRRADKLLAKYLDHLSDAKELLALMPMENTARRIEKQ